MPFAICPVNLSGSALASVASNSTAATEASDGRTTTCTDWPSNRSISPRRPNPVTPGASPNAARSSRQISR